VTQVVTAPGKLFVTGEWAVLAGAPALVAAVDRRARVEVEGGAGEELVIESLAEGTSRIADPTRGSLPPGDAGAVVAAIRAVCGRTGGAPLPARVRVDSRAFLVGERKLGLGRSAATLAATSAALLAAAGTHDRDVVLAAALAGNATLQEGRGSGADVAAAVHGGVVEVRVAGGTPTVVGRALPGGLRLVAGWTGESAPTAPLLARFAEATRGPAFAALVKAAADAAAAAAAGDADALLETVRRSAVLLDRVGAEADLPIVTPALRRLVEVASRLGIAAKPSGAGGGDCGIALVGSAREAAELARAWREAGIVPLELAVASEGVRRG
jgi:phosphomevalonate kinase